LIELLRLIKHKHVNSEATPRVLRSGDELDGPAVLQPNSLFAASVVDAALVFNPVRERARLKEGRNAIKRFRCRFRLMRCMKYLQAEYSRTVQLDNLDKRI